MVKIEKGESSNFQSFYCIKGQETTFWAGRLILLVGNTFNILYTSIFKWATQCFSKEKKKEQSYTYQVNVEEFSKAQKLFQKGQLGETEITDRIRKAQDAHQKEIAALDYIRRYRALQTLEVIRSKVGAIAILLGQSDYPSLVPDQLETVLSAGRELQDFLVQEKQILENSIPAQEVLQHLNQIFQQVKTYYSHLQTMGRVLPQKSPIRKQFVKHCRHFLNDIQKQHSMYKIPSSDPYLHALQVNEDRAWRAVELLKQQLVVLQGFQKK